MGGETERSRGEEGGKEPGMKGFTVAIIGADGAGKTTAARRVEGTLARPAKYIYMGDNPGASNVLLPTTRVIHAIHRARGAPSAGGPPDPRRRPPKGKWRAVRSILGLGNRFAEEWFRQILAWYHVGRGRVVLFDRHFYADCYAHDIDTKGRKISLSRRLHGFVLQWLYPKPDLVILLDAPAEVLWARKQEGTFEAVAHRREEYLCMGEVFANFAVVDASAPEGAVVEQISRLIIDRCGRK
jgi:thymidylate kinase